MADSIEIEHFAEGSKGRYVARVEGSRGSGELTYSRLGAETVIADHTRVDESLRGQGVGQALVERLVADTRDQGFRIVPLCPFVKAQFERHPEWSDLLKE